MGKGRAPCCAKVGLNKGSWTPEEDMRLIAYIRKYGHANWRALPKQAGNIAACLPGRTDNEIKNVWNTHLKKRVAPPPCGAAHQDHGAKKKKKLKTSSGTEATLPSPSPASSTTTTNFSTGESSSGAEQHSDSSNRDGELGDLISNDLEIPVGFDFDMLAAVDVDPVPPELYSSSCPSSASPCASSTSPPMAPGPLDLPPPEIDIDQELWSIIDGDGSFAGTTLPCHGNATGEAAATTTTSQEEDEEGKEWWLENLERELGLWGPMDDYQQPTGPLGLPHHPDPLPAMMVYDPVTSYFQPGPNVASSLQGPELTSNQMML
ncbi:hypothetical protein PR202_gb14500 [Eleusine coracana subsp. coracana]|uniref:Uncharacterized protein n=1 Tax=Eleusine coracana subsp. coracana TaxID=191504 RepID=A0AAV5ETC3_ELECO|nr:hypothetical protein PR202_gb14500 [Eleusine coracana subsp. coracana]